MSVSQSRARYEGQLAAAHRYLYNAAGAADALGDQGAVEDCHAMMQHIVAMQEDSLRGRRRHRRKLHLEVDSGAH